MVLLCVTVATVESVGLVEAPVVATTMVLRAMVVRVTATAVVLLWTVRSRLVVVALTLLHRCGWCG